jgi:ribose transport system permease protein
VSTIPAEPAAQSGTGSAWRTLAGLQARFPVLQVALLIAVYCYGAASLSGLSSWSGISHILWLAAFAGLAATGQTLLILMGGFDLSVSSFIVSSALTVSVLKEKWDVSYPVAILIAIVVGGILGAAAGQICHRFEIQPLIVTLAMGGIAIGLVQVQTGGTFAGSSPQWLIDLASPEATTFGVGIPPVVSIWALVAVLMALFLHRTRAGRHVMATGANPRAAEYSLINTRRVWTLAFAFSGVVSVLVGLLVAGAAASVDSTVGDPYLFQSVVAVIVGGTVFGGPGDYTRTVVGALFLTVVNVVLVGEGAIPADQNIVYGVAILLAVALYGRERRLRDRI